MLYTVYFGNANRSLVNNERTMCSDVLIQIKSRGSILLKEWFDTENVRSSSLYKFKFKSMLSMIAVICEA